MNKLVGTFSKRTIRDIELHGETVLLRADYNVPLTNDGKVADDFRIRASLPTVNYLLDRGCKVVIISHLGRPKGKKDTTYTLEPAADRLAKLLKHDVRFVDDCQGVRMKMAIKRSPKNSIIVCENLRFYSGEETNDMTFAKNLARNSGAKYFVQDGFGVVHRAHASTDAITHFLPSVAGLLLERECTTISAAMQTPERPLVAVLGGAKVSDKIPLIKSFIDIADTIIVGGAMANTFLSYKGKKLGKSKIEPEQEAVIDDIYQKIISKGKDAHDFLILPTDLAVASSIDIGASRKDVSVNHVGSDEYALDIGQVSAALAQAICAKAKTVVWNGTLGMAEIPAFAYASEQLAVTLKDHQSIKSIIGGGDTADFVIHWDKKAGKSFGHVSTGGGASLALMSGKPLPGVECLLDAQRKIEYTKSRKP